MKVLAEGRVIPERVDFNSEPIDLISQNDRGDQTIIRLEIIKSKIFVHIDAPDGTWREDLRNMMFDVVGNIVNAAGYQMVLGLSYELDSMTFLDQQSSWVPGVEGQVFDDITEFGSRITFQEAGGSSIKFDLVSFLDRSISRSTFELRNAIRYPGFTALHCRLSIESIRSGFNSTDENAGWQALRSNLNVGRDTIQSFADIANDQRHGRNRSQTWPERRRCMQIAWEICHRYRAWLEQSAPRQPLPLSKYELL